MTLKNIAEKFGDLGIYEKRCLDDNYCEVVFYNKELDEWNRIFTETLGPAAKPAGAKPTKEALAIAKAYGGIYANQTLFKKDFDAITIVAMFWPWQDSVHTTLKLILLKK